MLELSAIMTIKSGISQASKSLAYQRFLAMVVAIKLRVQMLLMLFQVAAVMTFSLAV